METDTINIEEQDFIEDFIKKLDISLAELEKAGAMLLTLGYSNFFIGADLDILEALEINTTGKSPDTVTLFGQQLVLTGYVILWVVASKRAKEKVLQNKHLNRKFNLNPYNQVANAYLVSVFANALRLEAFTQIDLITRNGEFIE